MLKKFDNFVDFKYFFERFEYGEFRIDCDYSTIGMRKAKHTYYDVLESKLTYDEYEMQYKDTPLNEEEALLKAFNRYNAYIDLD
ncbi:hypothetical protein [Clostridium massiliamazoniense]|uniref:hypothetical protein n=1 Tax=Clostridium massiliamazoniense TaxID=1347366 RepID=UPI0006D7AF0C|nr:hypothetical protein [Clostridium massiliamazoniense]